MTVPAGTGFVSQVPLDSTMKGGCIGQVVASRNADFPVGAKTEGMTNWQTYCLCAPGSPKLRALPPDADPEVEIGPAGGTALTAYFGLLRIGKPEPGETVLVSAAAGGTGVNAGMIAKIAGCRVVGTAGTDDKCRWLVEEMGFDAAVNYKSGDLRKELRAACPDGVDIFFDNVGGEILELALGLLNTFARVVICGAIANYQSAAPAGPKNYQALAGKHASMTGFTVYHYREELTEARAQLREWVAAGQMQTALSVYEGLSEAPAALMGLYAGDNQGKVTVRIGEEEALPPARL